MLNSMKSSFLLCYNREKYTLCEQEGRVGRWGGVLMRLDKHSVYRLGINICDHSVISLIRVRSSHSLLGHASVIEIR